MVLTEIPLWVTHGSNADGASSASKSSAMGIAGGGGGIPKATPTTNNNDDNNNKQRNDDLTAAKSAVALLQSTRGGAQRAPMYSVDVHPDGSRFATAAGDGTVKIWSMGSLFGGKLVNNNEEKKRKKATSRFMENGNYVSSNSEGYDTSSSVTSLANKKQPISKPQPPAAAAAMNDLSGLVRKKKGGTTATASTTSNNNHNPFAVTAPPSYSDSPLSRLTQRNSSIQNNNNSFQDTNLHKQHKLLTTISSHQGSVLALRFSTSGKYLATAGDDSYVNIYIRSNKPSLAKGNLVGVGTDGGKKEEDVEYWNRIALCRGHQLDVVGLAWAPDDSHLVSCSLDSVHPVIVWRLFDVLEKKSGGDNGMDGSGGGVTTFSSNTNSSVYVHNLHPFKVLGRNSHKSTVKGIAFDPAGKFIASSGDDPAICIWRAYDDWGLEARIDASSGVFRSKKRKKGSGGVGDNDEEEMDDPGELASLSMFRRISFAPDGSHVCGTNATLKGKNIAAMISREGWAASGPNPKKSSQSGGGNDDDDESHHHPPGAANLVGHKQPVVSSRHCPVFFTVPSSKRKRPPSAEEASSESESDNGGDGDEPEYATLVALGDKRGFVTVWSTKSSRPLFKMQCSESRCAVTDISWGLVRSSKGDGDDSLIMIVSLLDGFIVALHFSIPAEVGGGRLLSAEKTKRIFRLKYGIDDDGGKRLVDDSGPALIENALQFTMEMETADSDADNGSETTKSSTQMVQRNVTLGSNAAGGSIRDTQVVTTKKGKKRIAPVLLTGDSNVMNNVTADEDAGNQQRKKSKISNEQSTDPLENALNAAETAASAAEGVATNATNAESATVSQKQGQQPSAVATTKSGLSVGEVRIPYSTGKVMTTELITTKPLPTSNVFDTDERSSKIVADCVNSAPLSTGVSSWPFATLSISRGGVREWKDIITKTSCTAIVANEKMLAVGTANGCLYLYGTSPTLGWESGKAYRAFPPFVLGSPVVAINLSDAASNESEMVVVTSDGGFAVYKLLDSGPKLHYKGSIVPPMQQMLLSSISANQQSGNQPKLVRIQITDSKHLMLVLMLPTSSAGRALQGFVYNRDMDSWMLIADSSNFLLSEFYSPIHKPSSSKEGILSRVAKIVTSSASTMASAKQMYQRVVENEKHSYQYIITRSHCEDRLACAIVLDSKSEFEAWLTLYARCLTSSGESKALRFLVDTLLDASENDASMVDTDIDSCESVTSFLLVGIKRLGLDSKRIIRKSILPEMSKNRHLQRLTNEISTEIDNL